MRISLTMKVLGIVIAGLLCSLIIAGTSVYRMSKISTEMHLITEIYLPLNKVVAKLTIHEQEHLEILKTISRSFKEVDISTSKNFTESRARLYLLKQKLFADMIAGYKIIQLGVADFSTSVEFKKISREFELIRARFDTILQSTENVLALQSAAHIDEKRLTIHKAIADEQQIHKVLYTLQNQLMELTLNSSGATSNHVNIATNFIVWLSVIAVIASIIMANLLAYFSLTKPIRQILEFWKKLEKGDLSAELQVSSKDEIGELALESQAYQNILRMKEGMEEENRAHFRRLTISINHMRDGFVVYDKNDRLVMVNEAFRNFYAPIKEVIRPGIRYEELIRASLNAGMWDIGDIDPEEWLQTQLAGRNEETFEFETEGRLIDGRIMLRREKRNEMGEIVGTRVDVTDERRKQEELEHHKNNLEDLVNERTAVIEQQADILQKALEHEKEMNEVQKQFIYMASHEFRTPLAIIDSSAQRMLRKKDRLTADDIEKRMGIIHDAVVRMSSLMENVLSSARLDSEQGQPNFQSLNLIDLIDNICQLQQDLSPNHDIQFNRDNLPDEIIANGMALEQVFTNLLSNAVKYSPESPLIEVYGQVVDETVEICVRDHGIGIDEEDLPSMFQQFFRAKTATAIAGTGIGLNLVKRIIEEQGGTIRVDSKSGEGSVFTLCLPIDGAKVAEAEQQAVA